MPFNSRSTAWASFDGRGRVELKQGDHIKVTASKYPFPTVCADKQSTDWFHAISRTLKWNERERQKSFVVVEEGPAKDREKRKSSSMQYEVNGNGNGNGGANVIDDPPAAEPNADREDEDEDEEDETSDGEGQEDDFDITDSSPEGAAAAAKRAERRANSSGESSPPESSRSSSVGTTATGACAGPQIADLGGERQQQQPHSMPITTTPHPDALAFDEALAAAKALKGRKEDTLRTPRAPTHQPLATPQPPVPSQAPLPLPHTLHPHSHLHPHPHPHPHPHHPHLMHMHGVATPSGLRNEFTPPPAPPRRHHASSRSADFDAGTHRRAFAVWGQDESSDDNSP